MERIPARMIGVLSDIVAKHYSHNRINSLFLYAGAPDEVPEGNKPDKVQEWLRKTNHQSQEPLRVAGMILDDFMVLDAKESANQWGSMTITERAKELEADKKQVRETLAVDGLVFTAGGHLTKAGTSATLSLDEHVRKHGLSAIEIEIKRAFAQVEADPKAAAHYAGNVLEATCKAYLDHHQLTYNQEATLSDLWQVTAAHVGLRPKELEHKDLKRIASGLHNVVGGLMHLRNKKSASSGQSDEQVRNIVMKPRHARLAIHAAHTVAAYIVELMDTPEEKTAPELGAVAAQAATR